MIIATITVEIKSNYMSKEDFDDLKGYNPSTRWGDYDEYCATIKDPIEKHTITKQIRFDTDDIEIAKFLLTKVEGLVTVHSITVI